MGITFKTWNKIGTWDKISYHKIMRKKFGLSSRKRSPRLGILGGPLREVRLYYNLIGCGTCTLEYMKYHIFELRREIIRHD